MRKRLNNLLLCLASLLFILNTPHPLLAELTEKQTQTWFAPPPEEQLGREGKRDLVGLGRLFLPAMTSSDYEPFYTVESLADESLYSARMGESIYLRPGEYIAHFGSGTENQMMSKRVTVEREVVNIVEPTWAGLRVKLIDENRNSLDAQYELFRMLDAESFGFGLGALEEYGEQVQTWILRPERYKIVLNNKAFNTINDFATVDLVPGELRILTLVINSENSLIGAGVLETADSNKERKNLRFSSAIHGNFNLSSSNSTDKDNPTMNFLITAQLDNKLNYDIFPYYYTMHNLTDLGFSKDRDSDLRISTDSFKLRNTFVYYLSKLFGVYSRLDSETHLFPESSLFSEPTDIVIQNSSGNVIKKESGVDHIRTNPSFFPFVFREGVGVNVRPLNRPRATLNFRAGFGMRQDLYKNVYRFVEVDADNIHHYQEIDSNFKEGIEISVLANFHTPYNISYNTTADILVPFDKSESNTYNWENIFTVRFIRQLALDYKVNLSYNKDIKSWTDINHNVFVRLSYFIY
ncbi:MAG: DUF481 domain-containing protein [Candidatus Cloacimonadia bacterium]